MAKCLQAEHESLLADWRRRVFADSAMSRARELAEPLLTDSMPDFIDAVCAVLEWQEKESLCGWSGRKDALGQASKELARRIMAAGHDALEALRELSHLRNAILAVGHPTRSEGAAVKLLHRAIDLAMVEIAAEFAARQAEALERLRRTQAVTEEAERARALFLASLSHEIRTPLGVIIGYGELLKNHTVSPADIAEFVESISRNGRVLACLLEDVLELLTRESAHPAREDGALAGPSRPRACGGGEVMVRVLISRGWKRPPGSALA